MACASPGCGGERVYHGLQLFGPAEDALEVGDAPRDGACSGRYVNVAVAAGDNSADGGIVRNLNTRTAYEGILP
jgi:hypothetical protein